MDDALLMAAQAAKCGNSALMVRGSGTSRLVSSDIIIYSSIFRHLSQPACGPERASAQMRAIMRRGLPTG
jgi:hypothetical protein